MPNKFQNTTLINLIEVIFNIKHFILIIVKIYFNYEKVITYIYNIIILIIFIIILTFNSKRIFQTPKIYFIVIMG